MSEKRAATLLRRAKRQRKRTEWRAKQRFEDAVKVADALCSLGGVALDNEGQVIKAHPDMLEAYRAGRLRQAIREWRRR
jgi:hypothetical protein